MPASVRIGPIWCLAGCAIFDAIRQAFPSDRIRIADRGLREGMLTEMMGQDGVWRRGGYR